MVHETWLDIAEGHPIPEGCTLINRGNGKQNSTSQYLNMREIAGFTLRKSADGSLPSQIVLYSEQDGRAMTITGLNRLVATALSQTLESDGAIKLSTETIPPYTSRRFLSQPGEEEVAGIG